MSKESATIARRRSDGILVEVMPDGSTRLLADKTDWQRLRAMTDAEVEAAASSDPDAQPLTGERLARVPRVRTLRRALRLTQEEFAARYQIPRSARCVTGSRSGRSPIGPRVPTSRPSPATPRACDAHSRSRRRARVREKQGNIV